MNPYTAEDIAENILEALTMPIAESRRRMKLMRDSVKAAEIIKPLTQVAS